MTSPVLYLIVKGPLDAALKAARDRGIRLESARCTRGRGHNVIAVCDAALWTRVAQWFGEPGRAPFPDGALLLYTDHTLASAFGTTRPESLAIAHSDAAS